VTIVARPGVLAAVFSVQDDAVMAMLALHERIPARLEIGVRPIGGSSNDLRALLAVRHMDGEIERVSAIVREFRGSIISDAPDGMGSPSSR
jgi:hypothetical protein